MTTPRRRPPKLNIKPVPGGRVGSPRPTPRETRDRLRAYKILERLERYTLGEPDEFGRAIDLTPGQLQAARIALAKSLPDLAAVHQAPEGESLQDWLARLPMPRTVSETETVSDQAQPLEPPF